MPPSEKPARLGEEKTRGAAAFCIRRDGELIEIARRRIEIHKAKQPVRAVKSADRDRSRCFKFVQMIEKPWFPRRKNQSPASSLASLRPIDPRGSRDQCRPMAQRASLRWGREAGSCRSCGAKANGLRSPRERRIFSYAEQSGEYIFLTRHEKPPLELK